MKTLKLQTNPAVTAKLESYPKVIQEKLNDLRQLIIATASEIETIQTLEETLKWGEPSYLAKKGSTIRINWSPKTPKLFGIYFNCQSRLVPTFKMVFGDLFTYEKTRAILFNVEEDIPEAALKQCITLALTYHTIKDLPLLGL